MSAIKLLSIAVISLGVLSACTWVEPDSAGTHVRVSPTLQDGACPKVSEVTVSVKHRVAGVNRSDIKVRDELESLARNEAAASGADTIKAISEPVNGEQRFAAYKCH